MCIQNYSISAPYACSKITYEHGSSGREKRGQTLNRYEFEKRIVLIIG